MAEPSETAKAATPPSTAETNPPDSNEGELNKKLSIPFLTPQRQPSLNRLDAEYFVVDVVVNIEAVKVTSQRWYTIKF